MPDIVLVLHDKGGLGVGDVLHLLPLGPTILEPDLYLKKIYIIYIYVFVKIAIFLHP